MRYFECKSCGEVYRVEDERDPLWCSYCRSSLTEIVFNKTVEFKKWICEECFGVFFTRIDFQPYKCIYCNYTFEKSPGRIQEERL